MVRLFARPRRHVQSDRFIVGAVVRRSFGRQEAGASQHHQAHTRAGALRGAAARESGAAETAKAGRLQRDQLSVQVHSGSALTALWGMHLISITTGSSTMRMFSMVIAGPDVKNVDNMKVGDQVNAQYVEALTLELKKGGGMTVARSDQGGVLEAKPGQMPGGVAGRQVTIVADVVDVNPAKQSITLRGPKRTVEVVVPDPAQFKLVAKGDQVEATYTQALAILVEPAAKQ